MSRQDWITVCQVLHAAEIYEYGNAYVSLYPDGEPTVRLRHISEQTWDRWRALWA